MVKSAAEPVILVISGDKDFAYPLAEQVDNILKLPCMVAESYMAAQPFKPTLALVVSSEEVTQECALPVLKIKQPPLVMRVLLQEIDTVRRKHLREDIALGSGYQLQLRAKILMHTPSGNTVALTDKETQLLQYLKEAAGGAVSKEELLKHVWGMEAVLETHTLETHIYRLRGKFRELGDDEGIILASDGGYKLKTD